MVELKVNPGELAAGGRGLEEAAASIPEPLAPFTSTGTDALSTILNTLTQQKEAPLIEGLPATKAAALKTAQNIVTAAGMYERSDQQIATDVTNASARLGGDGGGGYGGGASSGGGVNSAGGASQMQQLMSVPMQVAQQVGQVASQLGQLPQGLMQGVQGGVQQVGQMIGGSGQAGDESEKLDPAKQGEDGERSASEGAASGHHSAERAPTTPSESDAAPRHAQTSDAGIVL